MNPNTESITAAASAMPKDRRSEAITRGVEMAFHMPSSPSSKGRSTSARSGISTSEVR